MQKLFRVESSKGFYGRTYLHVDDYVVIRETPQGKWISPFDGASTKRWVSNTGKKRFAHETPDGARQAFIRRRTRQIGILEAQLERAKAELLAAYNEIPNRFTTLCKLTPP